MNVKVFRIVGEVRKAESSMSFDLEVKDIKAEYAVERVLSEIGGRHRAKRFEIKILSVDEVSIQD